MSDKETTRTVPLYATDEMLWAAYQIDMTGDPGTYEDFIALCPGFRADWRRMWLAMVEAAP